MSPTSRIVVGPANLRDLGGMAIAGGRVVRPHRIYRSGHLADLDDRQAAVVVDLGLRTVIDLRRPEEQTLRPSRLPPGLVPEQHPIDEDTSPLSVVVHNIDDPAMIAEAPALVTRYYRSMVTERLDRFRGVFHRLVDPTSHPVLFHCTAGKDRAGFVSAALVCMLGATEETALGDYLFTNEARAQWIVERRAIFRSRIAERRGVPDASITDADGRAGDALLLAQPEFLRAAFAAVAETYGSWTAFRRDGLAIDDARWSAFVEAVSA